MNTEVSLLHKCPYCSRAFTTHFARDAHKGKCPQNPGKHITSPFPHYGRIFEIQEKIRQKREEIRKGQAELKELLAEYEAEYRQAVGELSRMKQILEGEMEAAQ
ncbi:hypothetical protein ApAK_07300 [Thermoplasmatales archaeon AK]|nr:hypothetical protein [Thermoplasmatales archaeon AK]